MVYTYIYFLIFYNFFKILYRGGRGECCFHLHTNVEWNDITKHSLISFKRSEICFSCLWDAVKYFVIDF